MATTQDDSNEAPYYPPLPADGGLGRAYRERTDSIKAGGGKMVIVETELWGTEQQRHATLDEVQRNARFLTDEELAAR